jgi:arsenical pump membrane protein
MSAAVATWIISGIATAGVITRPMRWPEWIWAIAGAVLLLGLGLMPIHAALAAVGKGTDVYLFLIGMMLLSETARMHGLFDWVAATAVNSAKGSTNRLFLLVYGAGVVVTTFLSNDATAVVLTPAVFAVARKADAEPLPLLLACALVANAASFVLPISNPANLVLYGGHMPPLGMWLGAFALPSLAAILVTFLVLRWVEANRLGASCACDIVREPLSRGGRGAFVGIAVTVLVLLVISAFDKPLGLPTAIVGIGSAIAVSLIARSSPLALFRDVSWGVLPLVAGLFVLVEGLGRTGVIHELAVAMQGISVRPTMAAAGSAGIVAVASNVVNNLPAGLIASTTIAKANPPQLVIDSVLIGVDLGPNLSVTGSLATILWLQVIRREGEDVGFWRFLKVGVVVMPTALITAIGARLIIG